MFRQITNMAFNIGLTSLMVSVLVGLARLIASGLGAVHSYTSLFATLGTVAVVVMLLFLLCGAVLWIEALVLTVMGWRTRGSVVSIARVILLAVGSIFAVYAFHGVVRLAERNAAAKPYDQQGGDGK